MWHWVPRPKGRKRYPWLSATDIEKGRQMMLRLAQVQYPGTCHLSIKTGYLGSVVAFKMLLFQRMKNIQFNIKQTSCDAINCRTSTLGYDARRIIVGSKLSSMLLPHYKKSQYDSKRSSKMLEMRKT